MSGIYFLLDGKEIVYIGQTKNFENRLIQHSNKNFTGYRFIECSDKKRRLLYEARWLNKFKPKYNKLIPNIGDYKYRLLRISERLLKKVQRQAKRNKRSFNKEVVYILSQGQPV